MGIDYHQRILETYNEWKTGDIDKGIAQFYEMYCEKHDYTFTHKLGTLILFENDFALGRPSPMDMIDFYPVFENRKNICGVKCPFFCVRACKLHAV